jgi:alpha-tubulin suppressor-like RCC1 family protein
VVLESGAVKCWGNNSYGQLGDNSATNRYVPTAVSGIDGTVGNKAVAIATGDFHTCVVLDSGVMKCWGNNADGQLGNDSTSQELVPVSVLGIDGSIAEKKAAALSAGDNTTCVVMLNATAKCWGDNSSGQLGDGTLIDRSVPTHVLAPDGSAPLSNAAVTNQIYSVTKQ